ncbi:hypothetical protein H4P12_16965 [Paracoccus sp. 11-3]|uniref:WG repeat protein n=1 Tax=Paracoccus amoyensis TaxID=2760093 RepID=A0A926GR27_9RHOB|nr:hypothetical protein [Paracoccus amoyensis]MBC9248360.1 hypothetical protein [Paracoccus amoyensis]
MDISPIKPFDPADTDEGWRQICGTWHSDNKFYAALRPKDATGFDGEDILVIRDDAFGPGLQFVALPDQDISRLIDGRNLLDPVDAVLLISEGQLLYLRNGLMRFEVLPGFENYPDLPAYISGMSEVDNKLWVSGSHGYIFCREGAGNWRLATANLMSGSSLQAVANFSLSGIDGIDGKIVAVGSDQNYRAAALQTIEPDEWAPLSLPSSWLTGISQMDGRFYIAARNGEIWVGSPEEGYRSALTQHYNVEFNAIGCWNGQIYVAGAEGPLWRIVDGALEEVVIPGPDYLYANRFEVRSQDCIIDAQNGFAVLQDDGIWRRINVPWGPGTFPA